MTYVRVDAVFFLTHFGSLIAFEIWNLCKLVMNLELLQKVLHMSLDLITNNGNSL